MLTNGAIFFAQTEYITSGYFFTCGISFVAYVGILYSHVLVTDECDVFVVFM